MESILTFIERLITSGQLSGTLLATILGIGSLGVLFFYTSKGITLLAPYFKPSTTSISKDDLEAMKVSLQDDNKYILKVLQDVHDRLKVIEATSDEVVELNRKLENEITKVNNLTDQIKDMQDEDVKTTTAIHRDLNLLLLDSKSQNIEITRQVQALQVDLASLTGTIIGLNTQRTRLK